VKPRLAVAALLVAFVAGCGGSDEDDSATPAPATAANGAQLFTANCSSCHTLAAAKASGKVGPDLDQLRPGPELVTKQVNDGGGSMPSFKGKLSDEQIKAIADYVSANAGKG
jgi:mono/diheme cytochrome c family protein